MKIVYFYSWGCTLLKKTYKLIQPTIIALKTTEIERTIFLTYLEYIPLPKAAKKTGINRKTTTNIKLRAINLEGEHLKASLPLPTI